MKERCYWIPLATQRRLLILYATLSSLLLYAMWTMWQQNIQNENSVCVPQQKVAFLKTHKCASSTVQNVLLRYGHRHTLNFVLPSAGYSLGTFTSFTESMLTTAPWHPLDYHIFAVHTVWNHEEVRKVMGHDTVYVSIVRDPVDVFESLYYYANFEESLGMDIETYINYLNVKTISSIRVNGNLGRNQMLFDFGLSPEFMDDEIIVREKIRDIDKNFNLVMIADKFDESSILLQDLLCWDLSDFVSFRLNARQLKYRHVLSTENRAKLRQWLWADQMLYDHFLGVFERLKKEFGIVKLNSKVKDLQRLTTQIRLSCGAVEVEPNQVEGIFRPWSDRVNGFKLSSKDKECFEYVTEELSFIDQIRQEQLARTLKNVTLPHAILLS